jgi:hypothetical protein
MNPISTSAAQLTEADRAVLARAKQALERQPLAMKLAAAVGAPIERLIERLPAPAHDTVAAATRVALEKCLQAALASVGQSGPLAPGPSKPSRDFWHKVAVATTGAAGGAFGLVALPAELPVTTALMFRSICDIARSEGEDLSSAETRLQCLSVFGLGGAATRHASADEDADFGYFITRGALAQTISKASSELASKGIAAPGASALMRFTNAIAARFSVQVSEQVAAKSIPAIGAVLGALVNTAFIDHFQQTAHGHFAVRRLERQYGADEVRLAYQAIERSPGG